MKKYAKLLSLAVALCLVLGLASTAYASMPDVNSHWAQASVEKWVDSGLAKGYPDGTFKPDNNITRAEFVALLNRAFTVQG
ncbi:MAG: S-layer homology domain-containing protein, partial [Peptococcaceae bacterium]|nr:S-layer homology domain-containing protein [Peptococcaceae bacterium]